MGTRGYHSLSKAEKKERLLLLLNEAISRLEKSDSKPTEWQFWKVWSAIQAAIDGWYGVAFADLGLAFADDVAQQWWGDSRPEELEAASAESLRAGLEKLRSSPVQEKPVVRWLNNAP